MKLALNGLDVVCIIGERPEERLREQHLRVEAELTVIDAAAVTDRLEDAVDYAALAERIRAALVAAKCRLIERAARIVAEVCLDDGRVGAVRVRVTKIGAVPGLESATAELELNNESRPRS